MGLAIDIGLFAGLDEDEDGLEWRRENLEAINRVLVAANLPPYDEPTTVNQDSRADCPSFPYSILHYLRRVAAKRRLDPSFVARPLPEGTDPSEDPAIEDAGATFDFHLLVHSDCEGYYVPVDFADVLIDDELPGGMLGSSQRLMRELVEVAPALGITLENGDLSDTEAARINQVAEADGPLFREHLAWIALFEAARISIRDRCTIVFN
jgi:hypothetical protein